MYIFSFRCFYNYFMYFILISEILSNEDLALSSVTGNSYSVVTVSVFLF